MSKVTNNQLMQRLNNLAMQVNSTEINRDQYFRRVLSSLNGTDRDYYDVFGYPNNLELENYEFKYKRNAVANRAVRIYPEATWKDAPIVEDSVSAKGEKSQFVEDWKKLAEDYKIYNYLERADRLNNLGRYSLLVMGFRDGKKLSEPLTKGNYPLEYLRPYFERNISINLRDNDPKSRRYGLPVTYTVQSGDVSGEANSQTRSYTVHYTRVLHIAEGLEDNEVFGTPRLQAIFNLINDLEKVTGGSAESYWLNARNTIIAKAQADARLTDADVEALKRQMNEFADKQRRTMAAQGVDFVNMSGNIFDPKGHVDVIEQQICGMLGVATRIFFGSERGQLASSQDQSGWSSKVDARRNNFAIPCMMRPLIQVMIDTQNVAEPHGQWKAYWNDGQTLSENDKAEIALKKSQSLATYINTSGSEEIVREGEFREWLGLDPDDLPSVEEIDLVEDDYLTAAEYSPTPLVVQSFKPPKGAQESAQKALDWREKYGDEVKGGTRVGWTRANQIAKGENLSEETISRMASFFARHDGNQAIAEEFSGEPWRDAGYVAWLLWGGDQGKIWAERVSRSLSDD